MERGTKEIMESMQAFRIVVSRMRNAKHGVGSPTIRLMPARVPVSEYREAILKTGDMANFVLRRLAELGARNLSTGVRSRDLGVPFNVLSKLRSTGLVDFKKDSRGQGRFYLTRRGLRLVGGE